MTMAIESEKRYTCPVLRIFGRQVFKKLPVSQCYEIKHFFPCFGFLGTVSHLNHSRQACLHYGYFFRLGLLPLEVFYKVGRIESWCTSLGAHSSTFLRYLGIWALWTNKELVHTLTKSGAVYFYCCWMSRVTLASWVALQSNIQAKTEYYLSQLCLD